MATFATCVPGDSLLTGQGHPCPRQTQAQLCMTLSVAHGPPAALSSSPASVCRVGCKQQVKLTPRGVNLASFREVRAFATELTSHRRPIHFLILNAAIAGAPFWCARPVCWRQHGSQP